MNDLTESAHTAPANEVIPEPRVWEEPVRGGYTDLQDFMTLPGLEVLRKTVRGDSPAPPIHHLTGLAIDGVSSGEAVFSMPATRWLLAPQNVITGSALALLVDGPLGCAVQTMLPTATPYTTAEVSMSFLRAAQVGGRLTATGTVVHSGRTTGLAEARVCDEAGALIAVASTRCLTMSPLHLDAARRDAEAAPPPVIRWPTPDPYLRDAAGAVIDAAVLDERSGLEILRGLIDGELPAPPIAHLCGIRPVHAEEGAAEWVIPSSEWLCSPVRGRLYGGAIAYVAGTALDGAYQTVLAPGSNAASVDMKVYFLRPVSPDGRNLHAAGRITHRGRRVLIATAEVRDAAGKVVALATGSALILQRRR